MRTASQAASSTWFGFHALIGRFGSLLVKGEARWGSIGMVLAAVCLVAFITSGALYLAARPVAELHDTMLRDVAAQSALPPEQASAAGVNESQLETTDVMSLMLRLAKESSITIVSVDTRDRQMKRIGSRDYAALKFSWQLRARLSQLVDFLNRFEQARSAGQASGFFLENLSARPEANQNWLVSADLIAVAGSAR